jgi:tetratricopeptide (TPR) repeat protein
MRGDTQAIAASLSALGDIAAAQKNPLLARSHYQEALQLFETLRDPAGVARVMADLGDLSRDCSDHEAARTYYLEALRQSVKVGRRSSIARILGAMAECAALASRPKRALTLAAAAAGLWRDVGAGGDIAAQESIQQVFDQTKLCMDPIEHTRLWGVGQSMAVDQVVQYAIGETD